LPSTLILHSVSHVWLVHPLLSRAPNEPGEQVDFTARHQIKVAEGYKENARIFHVECLFQATPCFYSKT